MWEACPLSPFRVVTGWVTRPLPATARAPVPLREVFYVSAHLAPCPAALGLPRALAERAAVPLATREGGRRCRLPRTCVLLPAWCAPGRHDTLTHTAAGLGTPAGQFYSCRGTAGPDPPTWQPPVPTTSSGPSSAQGVPTPADTACTGPGNRPPPRSAARQAANPLCRLSIVQACFACLLLLGNPLSDRHPPRPYKMSVTVSPVLYLKISVP